MAKAKQRTTTNLSDGPTVSPLTIGLVVVAALLIVGGLILLGNQFRGGTGSLDISRYPTLGEPDAPVTMIEFSDYG